MPKDASNPETEGSSPQVRVVPPCSLPLVASFLLVSLLHFPVECLMVGDRCPPNRYPSLDELQNSVSLVGVHAVCQKCES